MGMSSPMARERKWRLQREKEAQVGSSEKWYWENRLRQHEDRERLKSCLQEISEMSPEEHKAFLLRLGVEKDNSVEYLPKEQLPEDVIRELELGREARQVLEQAEPILRVSQKESFKE